MNLRKAKKKPIVFKNTYRIRYNSFWKMWQVSYLDGYPIGEYKSLQLAKDDLN